MKKLSILFFISLIITTCTMPSDLIKSTIDNPKKEGMLVGTISLENRILIESAYRFYYANDSLKSIFPKEKNMSRKNLTKDKHSVVISLKLSGDFKEDKKRVFLFNIIKPAGEYNFHEIEVFLNSGAIQETRTYKIDIPFKIEPGKITYFGELNFRYREGRIQVLNNIERDRIKFKEKFPEIIF